MGAPDIEGLTAFSRSSDRQLTPFFVGRRDEATDILRQLDAASQRYGSGNPAPAAGATRLIQGAPGAGKSSLLFELARRWDAAGGNAPRAVMLSLPDFSDSETLAAGIVRQLSPDGAAGLRQTGTATSGGSVRLPGVTASYSRSATTGPRGARDLLHTLDWSRPACLMIDEIQAFAGNATAFENLLEFHLGTHGLPIVPVFAGLASARAVLAWHGFSRLSSGAVHTLGCLDQADAVDAVGRFLDHYRVDLSGAECDWPDRLAELSDGWPMHLHNAMRALAVALAPVSGRLAGVDTAAVEQHAMDLRREAYFQLQDGRLEEACSLVAAVLQALPAEGARKSEVIGRIEQLARPESPAWRLPAGLSASTFFEFMVHRGVFQPGPENLYACPIPSFRQFLIEEGKPPTPAPSDPEFPEPF
ncbi:MAG: ATP-binding protein [Alphaproteobacteria bacterium]|nr:ATP-binding protein [Alphaproteobacteria bacterium]